MTDSMDLPAAIGVPLEESPREPRAPARPATRMLGQSPAFLRIMDEVSDLAPLDKPVLVVGERGTGKELIAERIHYLSSRWDAVFEKLNCAAISDTLLESELFGHEAGAFTGATRAHKGRFERADGGTLFLDELATTSALVQEKILRVIEYGEFERLGGNRTLQADIRLIAATNEDLPSLARAGEFREDLLDRLAFDVITLPPLRERAEDISLLAEAFAVRVTSELGRAVFSGFTPEVIDRMRTHPWPGNIRELKNVVERSVYRADSEQEPVSELILDPFDSPWRPRTSPTRGRPAPEAAPSEGAQASIEAEGSVEIDAPANTPANAQTTVAATSATVEEPFDLKERVRNFEYDQLSRALAHCQFNQKRTAEHLGMTYHTLRGLLRKYPELLQST